MSRRQGMMIVAVIGMVILTSMFLMRAPSESQVCEHLQQLLGDGAAKGEESEPDGGISGSKMSSGIDLDKGHLKQRCVDGLQKRRASLGYLEYREQARCIIGATKLTQLDACAGQEM